MYFFISFCMLCTVGLFESTYGFMGETVTYSDPSLCNENEYFDAQHLKCVQCDSKHHLHPSQDKLSCVCNFKSKIVHNNSQLLKCELCPPNTFPTKDQRECVPCNVNFTINSSLPECRACMKNQIMVERELNGTLHAHCQTCTLDTTPSSDGSTCLPCSIDKIIRDHNCSCPSTNYELANGGCVLSEVLTEWPDERETFLIEYNPALKIDSDFLKRYLLTAISSCKNKNSTACQMVANMCVMVLFSDNYKGSPCRLFKDSKHIPTSENNALPWLYYGEGDAPIVLGRKKIPTQYSLSSSSLVNRLNFTVARFLPNGTFNGISMASGSLLQLCPAPWNVLDSGLRFGARYRYSCRIPVKQLLQQETEFFDLYLQYWESGESRLYAVPTLAVNMRREGAHNNKARDSSQWLLTRRFFLIDKVSGIKSAIGKQQTESMPSVVRYLKSCEVKVKLQNQEEEGRIYPPLLVLKYGEITHEDIESNSVVSISFATSYEMSSSLSHALEVSLGVFCALAVVWSGIETWSFSRRSGRVGIDLFTLGELALFSCGNLANVFFLVVACASLHTFFFYKGESVIHILLPSTKHEELVRTYIIVAFSLKVVDVIYLIGHQISIDIFFIDWERPRALSSIIRTNTQGNSGHSTGEQPISIWRTYFVANEWNEIQTKRKISLLTQLILTIFFLKIVGLEHWGTAEPDIHVHVPAYMAGSPPNLICRFAVAVLVYMTVYLVQWLYLTIIHERYIKNGIQEFVDICSMANISVFILSLENFGFYIHGRSAHGFADTDMQTILTQLQREEDDLCGHRGLSPGTDHQTFQVSVPVQLRSYYKKVMTPISAMLQSSKRLSSAGAGAGGLRSMMASGHVDRSIQAYHNMNKFLAAFLEHALKDLDYEVKEKLFFEALLDIEFTESLDRGVFYVDSGHSFDRVLFYGNEFTLASFDIMLFCFVEALSHDFLLAAIITAVVAKILVVIRTIGGRRNLARKTLIDERFLI